MILLNGNKIIFSTFPNGETRVEPVSITNSICSFNNISFKYENDGDLIKLMFVKRYLDDFLLTKDNANLLVYYMPYSRQDRTEGTAVFTFKYVAEFVNKLGFSNVILVEPHSDVAAALINHASAQYLTLSLLNRVQKDVEFDKNLDYIFFPDAGAAKRYHNLKGYKQLVGYKNRDFQTGEIKSLEVVGDVPETPRKVVIIDDLSSYGGTFLHSGNKLKGLGFKEVYLLVAHCENSIFQGKLLKEESPIDKIYTTDSILTLVTPKIEQFKIEDEIYVAKRKMI